MSPIVSAIYWIYWRHGLKLLFWYHYFSRSCPGLLDHVRHRHFGVLLKHTGHQAVTSDIVNALKWRAEKIDHAQTWATPGPGNLGTVSPTWLISLVHAAFSWRDGAKRTTEKGGPSGGSTTILNSKWLKPWPAALSKEKEKRRHTVC